MGTLVKSNGNFFPNVSSLFDDFFTRDLFNLPGFNHTNGNLPAVNVKETDSDYLIEVAAPGVAKENFKVELENNMLIISAQQENRAEDKDDSGNYTRREFSYQSFKRSFNLPDNIIQGDNISARYNDGVLNITIPKKENMLVDHSRQIKIA